MARITVEDCVDKVPNRFELVLLSAHRARMISNGSPLTVDRENDKNPVVALREIADENVSPEDLNEDLIHSLQKYVEVDEPEPAPTPIEADAPEEDAGDHLRPHVGGGAAARPGEHRSAGTPRRLSGRSRPQAAARPRAASRCPRRPVRSPHSPGCKSFAVPILLIGKLFCAPRDGRR